MIEVEKKFQPTDAQLQAMLEGAEFLGEEHNHDIYYDYPDFRYFKQDVRLRKRNEKYEIKIKMSNFSEREIEGEEEVKKYFNISGSLADFIKQNFIVHMEFDTVRKKYKKDGIKIDIDEMSFGINYCELEIEVENESEVQVAQDRILAFAKKYDFEIKNLESKGAEYLKMFKPEVYKELYGAK